MKSKGMATEVFKLALAVIVVAALLAIFALFLADVRDSGQVSINATTSALEDFSGRIAERAANF